MPRNKRFVPTHEPLRDHDALQIQQEHTSGPFSFLNPTRAHYRPSTAIKPWTAAELTPSDEEKGTLPGKDEQEVSNVEFKWRSRDNRKGRHALIYDPAEDASTAKYMIPARTSSLHAISQGLYRMLTQYPYWDVSYLVATIFTLGSVIWVFNAFFVWYPDVNPMATFKNEILVGGGVTAFVGATVFELGSVLLMVEAVNENRAGCFGWALEKVLEGGGKIRLQPDKGGCRHHHTNKKNFVGKSDVKTTSLSGSASSDSSAVDGNEKKSRTTPEQGNSWIWFPSARELKIHYLRELGFLASIAQLFGASVFWISGFTALPGINNKMSQGLLDGIYWTPQIVGGSGFIVSGILFMLETQPKWYIPAPKVLGWHIGLWNLIGALGFTLSGALGPAYGNSGAQYQAGCATFWGSWAFLIGSVVQWYESLDKHPVEENGRDG